MTTRYLQLASRAWTRANIVIILAIFWVFPSVSGAEQHIYTKHGIAIDGADTVAYFTEKRALSGIQKFETEWDGAKWRFVSEKNLKAFLNNPTKFLPQYGGYCAYAVGQGYTAKIDPRAWTINDGKLYLNYSKSVRRVWKSDMQRFIILANKNWPNLSN